jgi:hypothetical protein
MITCHKKLDRWNGHFGHWEKVRNHARFHRCQKRHLLGAFGLNVILERELERVRKSYAKNS